MNWTGLRLLVLAVLAVGLLYTSHLPTELGTEEPKLNGSWNLFFDGSYGPGLAQGDPRAFLAGAFNDYEDGVPLVPRVYMRPTSAPSEQASRGGFAMPAQVPYLGCFACEFGTGDWFYMEEDEWLVVRKGFMVDSGAFMPICPRAIAEAMDLSPRDGRAVRGRGASGAQIQAWYFWMELTLQFDRSFHIEQGPSPCLLPIGLCDPQVIEEDVDTIIGPFKARVAFTETDSPNICLLGRLDVFKEVMFAFGGGGYRAAPVNPDLLHYEE